MGKYGGCTQIYVGRIHLAAQATMKVTSRLNFYYHQTHRSQASVSGEFEVLSSISALSSSSELQKKVLFLWPDQLKNCPNHIGTCQKQDLCALLTKFSALCKNGLPCRCPIAPKTYKFQTTFTAPKNSYGYLATGQFYYKIKFEENGAQVGCFDVYFDMED